MVLQQLERLQKDSTELEVYAKRLEKRGRFKKNNEVLVEAESANIGKCKIPYEFFNQMKKAQRIELSLIHI